MGFRNIVSLLTELTRAHGKITVNEHYAHGGFKLWSFH